MNAPRVLSSSFPDMSALVGGDAGSVGSPVLTGRREPGGTVDVGAGNAGIGAGNTGRAPGSPASSSRPHTRSGDIPLVDGGAPVGGNTGPAPNLPTKRLGARKNGYARGMGKPLSTAVLAALLLAGCGAEDGGTVDHALLTDQEKSTAVGSVLVIGPYQLPADAIVSWTVTDIPTELGPNSLDVTVATADSVAAGGTLMSYGDQRAVSSTTGMTPPLPNASNYDFVAFCRNPVVACTFRLTLIANY